MTRYTVEYEVFDEDMADWDCLFEDVEAEDGYEAADIVSATYDFPINIIYVEEAVL